jgi:acetyl esterase/lipase
MKPVPYDPELEAGLAAFLAIVESVPLRAGTIQQNREIFAALLPAMDQIVAGRAVHWEDRVVGDITLTVVRRAGEPPVAAPGIYQIHGGGMMLGTRFFGIEDLIRNALVYGTVGVAVEYRLAPEHPAPTPAEDCYAGLVWMAEHAEELGVDPARIVVAGASAGGGLTAAVALMARDRGGPAIAGQLVSAPMIDDRNSTVSSYQYDGIGAWDRNNNDTGWSALLGEAAGGPDVSPYAAPARATDLGGLPPAFIDAGAAEVFRDEAVAYASAIWAAGGEAELHIWAGAFHGFAGAAPQARVSTASTDALDSWLRRTLRLEVPRT